MIQLNNVVISGNLTSDPETSVTGGGTSITKFRIANNHGYGDKKKTAFLPVTTFGKTAENCSKFLKKGAFIVCTGRINQDSWEKDGEKKSMVSIVAENVQFGPPTQKEATEVAEGAPAQAETPTDDLPF